MTHVRQGVKTKPFANQCIDKNSQFGWLWNAFPLYPLFRHSRIVADPFGSIPTVFCPRTCKRLGKFAEWGIEMTVQRPLVDDIKIWLLSSLPRFALISLKTPQIVRSRFNRYNWDNQVSKSFLSCTIKRSIVNQIGNYKILSNFS